MKKIILLLLSMMLILSGCSGSKEEQTSAEQEPEMKISDEYFNLDLEDYLKLCETYTYSSVYDQMEDVEGVKVKYIAKLDTIVSENQGGVSEYIVRLIDDKDANSDNLEIADFIDYSTDNFAYLYFNASEETKLVEGDYYIVYGEIWGAKEVNSLSMPRINVVYLEMINE